jgi:hypothetical protein
MSTPEEPAGTPAGGTGYGTGRQPIGGYTVGGRGDLARMPVPGNAEFVVYLLILLFLIIVWAASPGLDAHGFAWDATILTGAYLLSRGIAKASRVLEQ